MSNVLIAGCGYVGTALALELNAAGHLVWGLRRNAGDLPRGIFPLYADLTQPDSLAEIPEGVDVVFYTAAAAAQEDEAYRAAYGEGLTNLLAALEPQRDTVKRIVFTSSTAVYGQEDGSWVDESSATEPPRFNGKRVLEAERILAASPFPGTTVRFGGIYGPGRTRVLEFVRSGRARLYPGPPSYTNRIHRDDCVGILEHIMQLDDPAPLYVGVDDDNATYNDLMSWLCAQFGMPTPDVLPEPKSANKRCSNALLAASGYRFRYPSFRDGYRALLDEMSGAAD